jgi:hypothetical protein
LVEVGRRSVRAVVGVDRGICGVDAEGGWDYAVTVSETSRGAVLSVRVVSAVGPSTPIAQEIRRTKWERLRNEWRWSQ